MSGDVIIQKSGDVFYRVVRRCDNTELSGDETIQKSGNIIIQKSGNVIIQRSGDVIIQK